MPESAGELLFQVIAGRAERAVVIVTTNLPFSEWSATLPNARLCEALIDRLTDEAHIIETGTESYRFRRTHARQRSAKAEWSKTVGPGARPPRWKGSAVRRRENNTLCCVRGGPNESIEVGQIKLTKPPHPVLT
jgi:hypothetical protein